VNVKTDNSALASTTGRDKIRLSSGSGKMKNRVRMPQFHFAWDIGIRAIEVGCTSVFSGSSISNGCDSRDGQLGHGGLNHFCVWQGSEARKPAVDGLFVGFSNLKGRRNLPGRVAAQGPRALRGTWRGPLVGLVWKERGRELRQR
jgi:hypothetical protein